MPTNWRGYAYPSQWQPSGGGQAKLCGAAPSSSGLAQNPQTDSWPQRAAVPSSGTARGVWASPPPEQFGMFNDPENKLSIKTISSSSRRHHFWSRSPQEAGEGCPAEPLNTGHPTNPQSTRSPGDSMGLQVAREYWLCRSGLGKGPGEALQGSRKRSDTKSKSWKAACWRAVRALGGRGGVRAGGSVVNSPSK